MTVNGLGNKYLFCTRSESVIQYSKEKVDREGGVVEPGCSEEHVDE